MIPVAIMIVVAMVVPPGPIFFLFLGGKPAEIAIRVAVVFVRPLPVVDDFLAGPHVIVRVIGIVEAVLVVCGTSDSYDGANQGDSHQNWGYVFGINTHIGRACWTVFEFGAVLQGSVVSGSIAVRREKSPWGQYPKNLPSKRGFVFFRMLFNWGRIVIDWLV
jgi:hypothetical protein